LPKPVDLQELGLKVRNILLAKACYDVLARRAEQLEHQVSQQAGELASAQREAQVRYLAGKAEIATDVLHNVGNALNSVNVGINMISLTMHDSRVKSLKRAVSLLGEQGENLAKFLTGDERGRILPAYLSDVTEALIAERDKIVSELELLKKHVDHINAVVSTQQKYAKVCQVFEDCTLRELLGDVEELLGTSLSKSGIAIIHEFTANPVVKSDRQRLLQVLLNLVKNAMEAVRMVHPPGSGRITLRLAARGMESATIAVSDNGIGIPRENLVKVFSHGFTTKKGGHGFGLHSCGNIMKEIGGAITVQSEGQGRGATFTLEIPYQPRERVS
jgi:two-component system NtrC family sensor kinase